MSRKVQITLAGVVTMLVGVVLIAPVASQTSSPSPSGSSASPSGSSSPSPSQSPSDPNHITITRLDAQNDDQELPIVHAGKRPRGFSKGDITTFRTPLLVPGTREKDGRLTAQCQVLALKETKIAFLCNAEAVFDEGRITAQGIVSFGEGVPASVIAITGGTGDFEHARGEVTVAENPNTITFDVHLE